MEDRISDEKLWSWVDREAPELEYYLERHPEVRHPHLLLGNFGVRRVRRVLECQTEAQRWWTGI